MLAGAQLDLDIKLMAQQLVAHPELLASSKAKLQLPTPIFDVKASKIVLPSTHASGSGTTERWAKLEQHALHSWDRKGKRPASLLPDQRKIVASVNGEARCLYRGDKLTRRGVPH